MGEGHVYTYAALSIKQGSARKVTGGTKRQRKQFVPENGRVLMMKMELELELELELLTVGG